MPPPRLPPSHSAPRIKLSPPMKKKQATSIAGGVSSTRATSSSMSSINSYSHSHSHINTNTNSNTNVNINSPAGRKLNEINDILSQPEIDLWALRELCLTEGGLVNDDMRKKAWPKLVGITIAKQTPGVHDKPQLGTIVPLSLSVISPESVSTFKNTIMASCIDAAQISLDTARCTWHLLNGSQRVNRNTIRNKHKKRVRSLLKRKQRRLGNFINLTLIRTYDESLKLRYYQGYHDISCIILSVLGGETTVPLSRMERIPNTIQAKATKTAHAMGLDLPSEVLAKLSHSHLKDMMKENFEFLIKALRLVVMPLIQSMDQEVHQHMVDCDMEPFFCLSWIITWFSHDIRDTAVVKRLFDLFIASHPLMPVYLSVAMVLHPMNRMEVLGADPDFASLHKALVQLPINSCSVGWKFIGSPMGGEYVTCSGEEDDDTCSFDGSILSQDVYREEGGGGFDDDDSLAPSLTSESMLSGCDNSRVPFQELIDLAIKMMRRIPPRTLIRLAHGYYDSETIQQLASDADGINLLHHPPQWAVAPSIESDFIAKKRLKAAQTKIKEEQSKSKKKELAHEAKYPHAVVAAGLGPDGDGDTRSRKKRRKLLSRGAVFVGFLSIVLSMVDKNMFYLPFSSNVTKVNAKSVVSVLHRSDKLHPNKENTRLSKAGKDYVVAVDAKASFDNETLHEEERSPVDFIVISEPPKKMPNDPKPKNESDHLKTINPKGVEEQVEADGSLHAHNKLQIPMEPMRVDPTHEELDGSNTLRKMTNLAKGYIMPERNGKTKDFIGDTSSPVQVLTAFIQQYKVKPVAFYLETKSAVSNLDIKKLRYSVSRELKMMVEITKEALSDEAEIVVL